MPPDLHRFNPAEARIYVRSEDGSQVEFNLDHVTEVHIDRSVEHDHMAAAFGVFSEAIQRASITLSGAISAIAKLSTPDGDKQDVTYEDWERMILNGIHN